jgi:hypothetical protein
MWGALAELNASSGKKMINSADKYKIRFIYFLSCIFKFNMKMKKRSVKIYKTKDGIPEMSIFASSEDLFIILHATYASKLIESPLLIMNNSSQKNLPRNISINLPGTAKRALLCHFQSVKEG